MANMGTAEFTVRVDPSRVLTVVEAMTMMVSLLRGYGHTWSDAERAALAAAHDALKRDNLLVEPV